MLARRQQELGAQRQQQQAFEQRWQQEQLRREAEQLRQQMEQLARNQSTQGGTAQGQQTDGALREATNALQRAEDEMRKAASERDPAAEQQAAGQLQQAQKLLNDMQREQSGKSVNDLARRAQDLANGQKEIANRLQQMYGGGGTSDRANLQPGVPGGNNGMPEMSDPRLGAGYRRRYWQQFEAEPTRPATQQEKAVAGDKEKLAAQLEALEREIQQQAHGMAGSQPAASSKLLDALSEAQQKELALRMKKSAEWMRQGFGSRTLGQEDSVTAGTEQLSRQLRDAQQAANAGDKGGQNGQGDAAARALAEVRSLRNQLERRGAQPGQKGQDGTGGPVGGGGPVIGGDYTGLPDTMRQLSGLRQQIGTRDRQLRNDIDGALGSLNHLYGAQSGLLEARIRQEVLPRLERLEVELNRRVGNEEENARTAASESAPEKYRDAVAEYFRKLSR
jgi:hypothetical protein